MSNFKEDLKKVKAFVFDVDGVFTDGGIYCMGDGEQVRKMNAKDGFAIRFAQKMGFPTGIISAGQKNIGVVKRLEYLQIEDLYMGSFKKTEAIVNFCKKHNLSLDSILYMGDDLPDYAVLKMVGVPTCPGDAAVEIKQASKYISNIDGGKGCVRDVIEQVLRAQGKWVKLDTDKPDVL
jgi:3-deoxy-D-manno-octulosonate 8-phosphate phosphatase (KDO 8-P phosphatase)